MFLLLTHNTTESVGLGGGGGVGKGKSRKYKDKRRINWKGTCVTNQYILYTYLNYIYIVCMYVSWSMAGERSDPPLNHSKLF